jgi:multidrug efflux pump subunit AcrA (membrane-fusion protein)
MKKRFPLAKALSFVGIVLVLQSCSGGDHEAPRMEQDPVAVRTVNVASSPLDQLYEAPGSVRSRQRAVLTSRLQAAVIAVPVSLGDAAEAGQLLVELDHAETDAEVERAQAAQAAAESGLQRAKNGLTAAEAEARLAAATFSRFRWLLERRSVSQQEFDQAEARSEAAEAAVEMAKAQPQEAEAHRAAAQAALKSARLRQSYARITAPFPGFVAEKNVDVGSVVSPGMPLIVLEDSRDYQFEVSLPETHIGSVRVGGTVQVNVPAISFEGSARIAEIQPGAEMGSRSALVRLNLPPHANLRSGLFGRALFATGSAEALLVPEELVLRQGDLRFVYAVSEGRARKRLVNVGRVADGNAEILSGLSEGEQIAASSLESLSDGVPVDILR